MATLIRQATLKDASDIAKVQVASWLAAYDTIVPAPVLAAQSVERQEAFWRGVLSQRSDNVLVAVNGSGEIVAWVSSGQFRKQREAKDKGEIYAIYARPDYFRSGTGRLLWESASPRLRQLGFLSVFALVITDNHRARAFYEGVGFTLVRESQSTFTWEGVQIGDVCYEYRYPKSALS